MITLEQVKLLETKVSKAIDTIQHLTEENRLLREKLEGYQNRINELEVFIQRFKDDQNKIEAGIISALDRLNKFEDILELELQVKQNNDSSKNPSVSPVVGSAVSNQPSSNSSSPEHITVQNTALDPNSDEAILAILEQEEKARQNTAAPHSISGNYNSTAGIVTNQTASGAELDIF
ncbi:cell division protein ZapB [Gracilinema caldarium]|uniref:Cell division protein ZapB n=1 Tax=Gracilinema caldarium (strain ATCC 51460 / DSM 7334 / H1) TaxID=744872 RepID=F8F1Z6_GRAC1|nr:cell division protein ZapB [Gracilinema caldarium]AEJ19843.1 hypothetical protein Spica_1700 [Gracilinema caldarium DSM 7334]